MNQFEITEAIGEAMFDVFRMRIDKVYTAYGDLPKIKRLVEKRSEIAKKLMDVDSELYLQLEETWNELTSIYEELIYRQGVVESDEFYKGFKQIGIVPKHEVEIEIMEVVSNE